MLTCNIEFFLDIGNCYPYGLSVIILPCVCDFRKKIAQLQDKNHIIIIFIYISVLFRNIYKMPIVLHFCLVAYHFASVGCQFHE